MTDKVLFNRRAQQACALMDKNQFPKAFNALSEAGTYTGEGDEKFPTYKLLWGMYYWFLAEKSWLRKRALRNKAVEMFLEVIDSKVNSPVEKDRALAYLSVYNLIYEEYPAVIRINLGVEKTTYNEVGDLKVPEYALLRAVNALAIMHNGHVGYTEALVREARWILQKIEAKNSLAYRYAYAYYHKANRQHTSMLMAKTTA